MDVLKFLLRLPFTVLKALCWLLSHLFRVLGLLLRPLLGEVNWRGPGWVSPLKAGFARLEQGIDRHPKTIALSVLLLAAAGVAGVYGWHWWQNRPKPIDVAPLTIQNSRVEAVNPERVDYTVAKPAVQALTLRFSQSVAPVTLVGKKVTDGISLKPELAGEWQWQNAWTLTFTPQQPLPMGASYEATLKPDTLLAPQIRIEQTHHTFSVPAFDYQIGSSEYYQDPQDSSQHSAIFNIKFNAPADVQSVEKQLSLGLSAAQGQPEQPLKFTVTWDEKKLNAWVRSTALQPMDHGGAVHLQINSGVKSSRPGNPVARKSDGWVTVPNLYSLSLSDITAEVVDKPGSQGERALIVGFSDAVRDSDVRKGVKAWLLPQKDPRRPASEQTEEEFTTWDVSNVDQSVINRSPVVSLSLNDAEETWQPQFSFKFDAPAKRYLLVSVDAAMTSNGA